MINYEKNLSASEMKGDFLLVDLAHICIAQN